MRAYIDGVLARMHTTMGETLEEEDGDVPGWVLITLMTAGLPVLTCRGLLPRIAAH